MWEACGMVRKKLLTTEQMALIYKQDAVTDNEAWEDFLVAKQMQGVSDRTIDLYHNVRRVIVRDLPIAEIESEMVDLTSKEIERLILYWKTVVKVPTINSRIRVMKTYYATLKKRKMLKNDPMASIHQMKEKEIIKDTLNEKEIAKIVKYFKSFGTFAHYRNLVMFELLLDTGLRISEALSIEVSDIVDSSVIIKETKSVRQRIVYPSPHCLHSLNTYQKIRGSSNCDYLFITVDGDKLSKSQFQIELRKAGRICKIEKNVGPHMLRRTYAKHAVLNGIDPFSLARLLGHEDLNTTKRYVQIYGTDLKEQSKKRGNFEELFK